MKIAQDIRSGGTIKMGGEPYLILKAEFNKSGRNSAVMKYKLKNLITGATTETVVKAADKLEEIRLDYRVMKFIYEDGGLYAFQDQENWEQIDFPEDDLGDVLNYLEEEMDLKVIFYESRAVGIELPNFVEKEVTYTEPGLKGDTTGRALKPAQINTGFEIMVPLFINQGDILKIDTRNNSYIERVKK